MVTTALHPIVEEPFHDLSAPPAYQLSAYVRHMSDDAAMRPHHLELSNEQAPLPSFDIDTRLHIRLIFSSKESLVPTPDGAIMDGYLVGLRLLSEYHATFVIAGIWQEMLQLAFLKVPVELCNVDKLIFYNNGKLPLGSVAGWYGKFLPSWALRNRLISLYPNFFEEAAPRRSHLSRLTDTLWLFQRTPAIRAIPRLVRVKPQAVHL